MMTKQQRILNFIAAIRNSHSKMVDIFTQGSCLNMFIILRKLYPEAQAYYNRDHIITKIGNEYYDITGMVDPFGYELFDTYLAEHDRRFKTVRAMLKCEYSLTQKIG